MKRYIVYTKRNFTLPTDAGSLCFVPVSEKKKCSKIWQKRSTTYWYEALFFERRTGRRRYSILRDENRLGYSSRIFLNRRPFRHLKQNVFFLNASCFGRLW